MSSEIATRLKTLLSQPQQDKKSQTEKDDAHRLDELRRCFAKLISDGELMINDNSKAVPPTHSSDAATDTDVKRKWNSWLKKQHSKFVSQLRRSICNNKKYALRTFVGVIASSPVFVAGEDDDNEEEEEKEAFYEMMDLDLVCEMIKSLCVTTERLEPSMLQMLEREFLRPYRDVQYFTLLAVSQIARDFNERYDKNDDDADEEEEERRGIVADNLVQILLVTDTADDKTKLNRGKYLIPPPSPPSPPKKEDRSEKPLDSDAEDDSVDESSSDGEETDDSDADIKIKPTKAGRKRIAPVSSVQKSTRTRPQKRRRRHRKRYKLPLQHLKNHKRALGNAWLSALQLPHLPPSTHKLVLRHLPQNVFPKMDAPLRCSEFFIRSYDVKKGPTALLALEGLFALMTQHGLEYPQFYASLYALLEPHLFYAKHRTTLFQLLHTCLCQSQMLPSYLIAAFCKKLCRCALSAPPTGAMFAVALVTNLLRQHPQCQSIIRRQQIQESRQDLFDAEATDPASSNALQSCLWELDCLEQHYFANVCGIAKSCGRQEETTTELYRLEDFWTLTYDLLMEQELKKHKKKVAMAFRKPEGLFGKDVFEGMISIPKKD